MARTIRELTDWLGQLPWSAVIAVGADGSTLISSAPEGSTFVLGQESPPDNFMTCPEAKLTAGQLRMKYESLQPGQGWAVHPDFPRVDWAQCCLNEDTTAGYWDWVAANIAVNDLLS